jgi:hypothetical protein
VSFWINEVKLERTDLDTIASPGREPDESLAAVVAASSMPMLIDSQDVCTVPGDCRLNGLPMPQ